MFIDSTSGSRLKTTGPTPGGQIDRPSLRLHYGGTTPAGKNHTRRANRQAILMKRLLAAILFGWAWTGAAVAADEEAPATVSLMARDSLAGWDPGPEAPRGWIARDGTLRGEGPRNSLVSRWTFGDFELQYRWHGTPGARLVLEWLAAPDGKIVPAATQSLRVSAEANSGKTVRRGNSWHAIEGDAVMPLPDGVALPARLALRLSAEGGAVVITELRLREPEGQPIFNGRDLTGWWTPGNLASWPVIDGNLVCVNQKGDYLRSEREYGNFVLSLDYRMAAGGNSGIGIRTPREGWPSGEGMELQLMDEPAGTPLTRHSTMAIYGNLEPLARADRSTQWNHVVVRAEGYMVTAWINGELVQQANTFTLPELRHRFLAGWIGLQDHGARTEFRNLRVLELAPLPGLAAWTAPRPSTGSEIVVNRLMNLAELTRPGGEGLRVAGAEGSRDVAASEQVVADVRGSGALVCVSIEPSRGRLRFELDEGPQPAVECAVADLAAHVPTLTADASPRLVYVPFARRLKVTLVGNPAARCRCEYVPLPESAIEAFAGPDRTATRGLLPALSYRYEQHKFGGLKKYDQLSRQQSEKQTVAPGGRVELVRLPGAGIVHWWRLRCANRALQNDDLWIEVTVDGERSPAIEVPLRYLFPGLDQGKNYQNFAVLQREGFVNRLAMPFAQGISLAVVNRGKKAIKDLECTVAYDDSYRPADGTRYQLRSALARDAGSWHLRFTDPVRLVGWVGPELETAAKAKIELTPPGDKPAATTRDELLALPPTGEVRNTLNGRYDGLAWRWWLLGPPAVQAMSGDASGLGPVAVFYYALPGTGVTGSAE